MKRFVLFPALLFIGFFISCNEREKREEDRQKDDLRNTEERSVGPDQLLSQWDEAWNRNDTTAIDSLVADNALLLYNGSSSTGRDIQAWIEENTGLMRELRSQVDVEGSGEDFAYQAGTYTHGSTENDTIESSGAYTIIWERQRRANDWRARVINISSRDSRDTLVVE